VVRYIGSIRTAFFLSWRHVECCCLAVADIAMGSTPKKKARRQEGAGDQG